jgi:hypothetical protein
VISNKTVLQDRNRIPFLVLFQFYLDQEKKNPHLGAGRSRILPQCSEPSVKGKDRPQDQAFARQQYFSRIYFYSCFLLIATDSSFPLIIAL